jgi:2-methylcitrate dehydratase PrpD
VAVLTHTAAILDFAAAPHTLPPQVRADAERLLADTLAVGAAGAALEGSRLWSVVAGWGVGSEARALGGGRLPAPSAAFFNGFAIHCLEWDAVHEPAVVHALSVVTAALLAASDRRGGSEADDFLTALAVGVDVASGLGVAATGPMRFFRPATAGVLGAALAVARLEGLTRAQTSDAFGLAYSSIAGTMQAHVEGSVALPLQIGAAARAAVGAVDLAKAGMDGPHDVLTGPFGYAALIEPLDLSRYMPGAPWRISEVSIKPFPSGRASHGALGALHSIDERVEDIASITLHAPPLIHRLVGRPCKPDAPMSYNRLCFAFLAPLMLRDGFIDPRLTETDQDIAQCVSVIPNDNCDGNAFLPQRIVVTLRDGRVIERTIDTSPGSPEDHESWRWCSKYSLIDELIGSLPDPSLSDAPLTYATVPA